MALRPSRWAVALATPRLHCLVGCWSNEQPRSANDFRKVELSMRLFLIADLTGPAGDHDTIVVVLPRGLILEEYLIQRVGQADRPGSPTHPNVLAKRRFGVSRPRTRP
jgi:hypothetical protein